MSPTKRNDEKNEVATVGPNDLSYLKDHMEEDHSVDDMTKYRIVPRLKIIQQMTKSDLKKKIGEGNVCIMPGEVAITREEGQIFKFIPLFFFTEWIKWNDREDTASQMIEDRTFDATHDIARAAADPNLRFEKYGPENPKTGEPKFVRRNVEHLNFAGVIYGGDMHDVPVVLGFSRGEHNRGRGWISAICLRKIEGVQTPLWSQIWNISVGLRQGENEWYGFDCTNPEGDDPLYIEKEDVEKYKDLHIQLKKDFEKRRLVVDHSETDDDELSNDVKKTSEF